MKKLLLAGLILVMPAALSAQAPAGKSARANAGATARPAAQHAQRPAVKRNVSNKRKVATKPNVTRPAASGNRRRGNTTVVINNRTTHNWNGRRVHGGRYRYPHGFRYHRHGIGHVLPRVFLTATYFYTAYAVLGLAAPQQGYSWVRYGPDLLLVDTRSGSVRDVRYGVFDE